MSDPTPRLLRPARALGGRLVAFVNEVGGVVLLLGRTLAWIPRRPFGFRLLLQQMQTLGVQSLPVILLTAIFTGMVLAYQSYQGFVRFGAESLVGTIVALSVTREMAPVFCGLMLSGRVGAAMAAELGTMRVTEQVDALETLATNPVKYLVVPRIIACTLVMPVLVLFADLVGIVGGYLVSTKLLGVDDGVYVQRTWQYLEWTDLRMGLIKSVVFGAVVALIGCYNGFYAKGGAEGVGFATTRAVVVSSILVFVFDYFLTVLLL
ncbi:MAG: ABC transporter permease [Deltaproteobacteria bacterium]|nr:ABC transporter permease [Deltaproteobacteria bacterium]